MVKKKSQAYFNSIKEEIIAGTKSIVGFVVKATNGKEYLVSDQAVIEDTPIFIGWEFTVVNSAKMVPNRDNTMNRISPNPDIFVFSVDSIKYLRHVASKADQPVNVANDREFDDGRYHSYSYYKLPSLLSFEIHNTESFMKFVSLTEDEIQHAILTRIDYAASRKKTK